MAIILHRIHWGPLLHTLVLIAVVGGQCPDLASADDHPVPIGFITANPQANNRKAVLLHGIATKIRSVNGTDVYGKATCGQAFTLDDPTGSLEVWYIIRCGFAETAVVVAEQDELLVTGTIDALQSTDVKASAGPNPGFRAMAQKISKVKH